MQRPTIEVEEAQTMATNWRYGGEALPYGQRDRKRPGEDFGQTGDGKRVNYYDKNNDNYKQERPPPLNDPRFHLATAPKEHPVYSVYQSPFNASHSSIGSARAGEFRSKYYSSICILDLLAVLRTTP